MDSQRKRQFPVATKMKQPPKTSEATLWTCCYWRHCTEELPCTAKVWWAIGSVTLLLPWFRHSSQIVVRYEESTRLSLCLGARCNKYICICGTQLQHHHAQNAEITTQCKHNPTIPQSYHETYTQPWPLSHVHHCHKLLCACTHRQGRTLTHTHTCSHTQTHTHTQRDVHTRAHTRVYIQPPHHQHKLQWMTTMTVSFIIALLMTWKTPPAQVTEGQDHTHTRQHKDKFWFVPFVQLQLAVVSWTWPCATCAGGVSSSHELAEL